MPGAHRSISPEEVVAGLACPLVRSCASKGTVKRIETVERVLRDGFGVGW